jgi:hypothetical protein
VDALGTKYQPILPTEMFLCTEKPLSANLQILLIYRMGFYPVITARILGTLSTSEPAPSTDHSLKIYPNPVYDYIFVSGETEN